MSNLRTLSIDSKRPPQTPIDAAQHDWLRVTLSSIGDGVITTDANGAVTFMNPVAESLTGWRSEEAAGLPLVDVFNIVNEETYLKVENPAILALRDGVVVGLANHTLLIARDGAARPIDDSAAPIRDTDGVVGGVVLVFRDVSTRRTSERLLRQAYAYSENIIATLRVPFLVLDGELEIKRANQAFYDSFRAVPAEVENLPLYEQGDGQWEIPELREVLNSVAQGGPGFEGLRIEGDFFRIGRRILVLNARRTCQPGNHADMILLAFEDVTEEQRAQDALVESERRYRRLFETAQDAILIVDATTSLVTDANPFLQDLLGYSLDEFVGKELWELGMFKDKGALKTAFAAIKRTGYLRFDHLPLETRTGQVVDAEFVSNLYEVDRVPIIQCNIRDITERRRLERETQEQTEALAELHRRKDEFIAMLSHELRSPLAPIANAVRLLDMEAGSPMQRHARGIIERQLSQLTRLVDDLLEISRIATGRIILRMAPVDARGVARRAAETVAPVLGPRGHQLHVSVPEEPLWVSADSARLEQILVNLLTNAAKYTNQGGEIWLSLLAERDECVIRVRDTGIGIPPETLPLVFELFTQVERSLDRSQGGLGIGLALVQRLTELHGGRVEAASVLGTGSEFVVRLPMIRQETIGGAQDEPAFPLALCERPLRVLVVDDNEDSAVSLSLLLTALGHQVETNFDGHTAVQTSREFVPQVVLLDIGLPGLDGYEVAQQIRQQPGMAAAMIIAVTGYGQEEDRQRSREALFDHHFTKPADFAELMGILATTAG